MILYLQYFFKVFLLYEGGEWLCFIRKAILFHNLAETKIGFHEKLKKPNCDENENDQIGFSSRHELVKIIIAIR